MMIDFFWNNLEHENKELEPTILETYRNIMEFNYKREV